MAIDAPFLLSLYNAFINFFNNKFPIRKGVPHIKILKAKGENHR